MRELEFFDVLVEYTEYKPLVGLLSKLFMAYDKSIDKALETIYSLEDMGFIKVGLRPTGFPVVKRNYPISAGLEMYTNLEFNGAIPTTEPQVVNKHFSMLGHYIRGRDIDTNEGLPLDILNSIPYEWDYESTGDSTLEFLHSFYKDSSIHFSHKYDSRGRIYSLGSIISPQGDKSFRGQLKYTGGEDIIHYDATASGSQILAILSNDKEMIDLTLNRDIYLDLANKIGVDRPRAKEALMTHLYGSTKAPTSIFNSKELEAFYDTVNLDYTPISGVFQIIKDAEQHLNKTKSKLSWSLPDGFVASQTNTVNIDYAVPYREDDFIIDFTEKVEGIDKNSKALPANVVHSIDAYITRSLVVWASPTKLDVDEEVLYKAYKKTGIVSPLWLHSDIYQEYEGIADEVANMENYDVGGFNITPIHDSFGVLEEHKDTVNKMYTYLLYSLYSSNLLKSIFKDLGLSIAVKQGSVDNAERLILTATPLA